VQSVSCSGGSLGFQWLKTDWTKNPSEHQESSDILQAQKSSAYITIIIKVFNYLIQGKQQAGSA